jgi:hypothetical protein
LRRRCAGCGRRIETPVYWLSDRIEEDVTGDERRESLLGAGSVPYGRRTCRQTDDGEQGKDGFD